MHDLVIRGGTVVDGTGAPRATADVAIDGERIAAVGDATSGAGRREIDARGLLVTPGWVDIHTHYDGQVTWDPLLTPSCWHGVTTVVMGNCGVGFAPVRPGQHDCLIELMEGVEDIPGTALAEGIDWEWESFPEYLDALERMPRALDVGAQVPHGAVRAYVMGERGATERAGDARGHRARWRRSCARRCARARSASRRRARILHRAKRRRARARHASPADDELLGIGRALGEVGHGVLRGGERPRARGRRARAGCEQLARETGPPRHVRAVCRTTVDPDQWRRLLPPCERGRAPRARTSTPQVARAPTGLLLGLREHGPPVPVPAGLPGDRAPAARRARRARCAIRTCARRILAEQPDRTGAARSALLADRSGFAQDLPARRSADYEPARSRASRAIAQREGRGAARGRLRPAARARRPRAPLPAAPQLRERQPRGDPRDAACTRSAVLGLGDGGAHCGADLRRQHADLPAHALGARPHARRAHPARAGRCAAQTRRHRALLRPRTTAALLAPGHEGRPERDRLRAPAPRTRRRWSTTCPPAAAA